MIGPSVEKFCEVAYRRVATRDEYGDENWGAGQEIQRLLDKLSADEPELASQWRLGRTKRPRPLYEMWLDPLASAVVAGLRGVVRSLLSG
jgi:hypothetical protein